MFEKEKKTINERPQYRVCWWFFIFHLHVSQLKVPGMNTEQQQQQKTIKKSFYFLYSERFYFYFRIV